MTKKILIFFSLVIAAFSGFSHGVDPSIAANAGLNFWAFKSPVKVQPVITKTYTISDQNGPIYYIFDINPEGFVIVAAEDAVKPILAYSFEGNYQAENQAPAYTDWMDQYKQYILSARAQNKQAEQSVADEWALYAKPLTQVKAGAKGVTPLVATKWDQGKYYNHACPAHTAGPDGHCVTGCVATSMAQIMKYWNYPEHGYGSHSYEHPFYGTLSVDYSNTTFAWDSMTNYGNLNSQHSISQLMYACGVGVDMNYSPLSSGSQTDLAVDVLKNYFNYRNTIKIIDREDYTAAEWRNIIIDNLENGMPMIYSGSGAEGGHAWVCDGYQDTSNFHMNWGWSGSNNGYFDLENLTEFPSGHQVVVNIIPVTEYYCQAHRVYTESTRTIGDGSGYSYYWNNTSCDWLIQPAGATEISLNFTAFNTEDGKDFVSVYDGTTTAAPLLGTFSGTSVPAPLTATSGSMLITFSSDATNQYQGWEAIYTATFPEGTLENDLDNVAVYPNPVGDRLNINFGNVTGKDVIVKILSLTGQLVYSGNLTSAPATYSIDLSKLDSGIYFISLTSEQNTTCKKIAKQ